MDLTGFLVFIFGYGSIEPLQLSDSRPGSLSKNIESVGYPKLRRFLLQTTNNEVLLNAFMTTRISCGEPEWMQDLHNALKVAASIAMFPDALLNNTEPLLDLDELLGDKFRFVEEKELPFIDWFGPARIVDSFDTNELLISIKEDQQPVVHFKLDTAVTMKQNDPAKNITVDEHLYELYLVNDNIIRGKEGIFYRLTKDQYAPILKKDMGEDVTSLVYILHGQPKYGVKQEYSNDLNINPAFLFASAFFLGTAVAMFFIK